MAFRSTSSFRWMLRRLSGNVPSTTTSTRTRTYATSTVPKPKPYTPATGYNQFQPHDHRQTITSKFRPVKGEFVPVYVAVGLIVLQMAIGFHTVKQLLVNSPNVRVNKKRREMVSEVEEPEKVLEEADRFQKNSFFRKIAHVQDVEYGDHPVRDEIRKDAFAYKPRAVTLKDVGVDPKAH